MSKLERIFYGFSQTIRRTPKTYETEEQAIIGKALEILKNNGYGVSTVTDLPPFKEIEDLSKE